MQRVPCQGPDVDSWHEIEGREGVVIHGWGDVGRLSGLPSAVRSWCASRVGCGSAAGVERWSPRLLWVHEPGAGFGDKMMRSGVHLEAAKNKGAPGQPSDPDAVCEKIADYNRRIADEDDPLRQVELIPKRLDSQQHLSGLQATPTWTNSSRTSSRSLPSTANARASPTRHGAKLGVPAAVLRKPEPTTRRTA